jgi:hypothetical protein
LEIGAYRYKEPFCYLQTIVESRDSALPVGLLWFYPLFFSIAGETGSGMAGVMPAGMSQSLDMPALTQVNTRLTNYEVQWFPSGYLRGTHCVVLPV